MLPQKKKKKGRNALKIAQIEPMSQEDFRELVGQRMDRKVMDARFTKQGDFLRWLKKTGNASGPRVRGI